MLLSVDGVWKRFGPDPVLADISFVVRAKEKVSLVGPNGTGKTTLMKVLSGQHEADQGEVLWHGGARFGFLEQQHEFEPSTTVWDAAAEALRELRELATTAELLAGQLAQATNPGERKTLGEKYDRVQHQLEQRGGYQFEHRIERILQGLGFDQTTYRQPVAQLSGGEQNRLMMARLLLEEPDLLLLDEPSNHLDMRATEWLEEYLSAAKSAVLVVSHDRYFLDKVTSRTLELFRGSVEDYTGNFTAYRRQAAERVEVQRRTYEKQQAEIAKMEDFVRRNHHGQKHAQAEDRRKKLERIEAVPPPREISTPSMRFAEADRVGDVALRVEHLSKGFSSALFNDLTFDILRGERWGIVGPNGCGKTTLLRCLLEREVPDEGRVIWGAHVRVGYFDQHLSDLDAAQPVLDAIRAGQDDFPEQTRRDLLARFGLTGDIVHQPVGSLSGGERNRAALARLAGSTANFLVLDEPTNHLDLWSRSALERAIQEFNGTVLFVTHDRYFVNRVADHLLAVDEGRFRVIEGNYDSFRRLVDPKSSSTPAGDARRPAKKQNETKQQGKRRRKFPYRTVPAIEEDIAACEQRIGQLHADLADPINARDGDRMKELNGELEDETNALELLYAHWEEAMELN